MIKTVLLATDLGVQTPYILRHAIDVAKQNTAKLVIVHAVEPLGTLGHALLHAYLKPETIQVLTTTGLDAVVKEVKAQLIESLTEEYMEGDVDLLCLNNVIVETGSPVDVIENAVDTVQADLIVLGSQASAAGLGSVAQKILCCTKVPVYVVPSVPYPWQTSGIHLNNNKLNP